MTLKKTVFILGAGASAHTGVPVISGFVDKVRDIDTDGSGGTFQQDFRTIVDLIRRKLMAVPAARKVDLHNVEEVFSLIEMGRLIGRIPGVVDTDLEALAVSMRLVLAQTVDSACRFQLDTENGLSPTKGYDRLAAFINDRRRAPERHYSFISFNYDLALEAGMISHGVQFDYGLDTEIRAGSLPGSKLHGSINWFREEGRLRIRSVHDLWNRAANSPRRASPSRVALGALRDDAHPGRPDVALIPPSWNKTQDQETFGTIWRHAGEELSSAESVVIVGYSAPRSDAFFSDLMALGLASASQSLRRIVLVDNNASAGKRYTEEILGPDTQAIFTQVPARFEDWAATLPNGSLPDWAL